MSVRTKKHSSVKESVLKYQKISYGWGMSALFEGNLMTFSGVFKLPKNTKKIFSWKKTKPESSKKNALKSVDIYNLFSNSAKYAWVNANKLAMKKSSQVGIEHIFLSLLEQNSVKNLFLRLRVDITAAKTLTENYIKLTSKPDSKTVKIIPFEAFTTAVKLHNHKVGTLMLLAALLKTAPQDSILQAIFSNIGLTVEKVELFAVWTLNLNYEFPENSTAFKYLYCCRVAEMLEEHFGYFFELPAIELAVILSAGATLKDLEHKKALQLLVKASGLAKNRNSKIISENLVKEVAQR